MALCLKHIVEMDRLDMGMLHHDIQLYFQKFKGRFIHSLMMDHDTGGSA